MAACLFLHGIPILPPENISLFRLTFPALFRQISHFICPCCSDFAYFVQKGCPPLTDAFSENLYRSCDIDWIVKHFTSHCLSATIEPDSRERHAPSDHQSKREEWTMARFTLPRDIYYGKGTLETLKTLKGKRAIIVVGGGSMKRLWLFGQSGGLPQRSWPGSSAV